MKILFINGGSRSFGERFRESCKTLGVECVSVRGARIVLSLKDGEVKVWHKGERLHLEEFDYAFVRVRGRVPHTISLLIRLFIHLKIPHNDSMNIEHTESREKITQMLRLTLNGLPIPATCLFNRFSLKHNKDVLNTEREYPCVLKTSGSKGDMVWKVGSFEEVEEKVGSLENEMFLLQEYIPNDSDIRVLYTYGEILGAMQRTSNDGFYNNIARGALSEDIDIDAEEKRISKEACRALGTEFAGVDLVRTGGGPLIFEVNAEPQVYGFEDVTGIDVPQEIVKKIKEQCDSER